MGKDRSADGLRGIAALSVVIHHMLLAFFPLSMVKIIPWVAVPGAAPDSISLIASMPILSTLFNGRLAVCVFFVLSGYVLSRGFIVSGDSEHVRAQAARRYVRLGVPIFASALFAYVVLAAGLYRNEAASAISQSMWLFTSKPVGMTWLEAVRQGVYGAIFLSEATVNPVLRTMQTEFFGSMLIFAFCLLGVGREKIMAVLFLALTVCASPTQWPLYWGFLMGYYIAKAEAPASKSIPNLAVFIGVIFAGIPGDSWVCGALPGTTSADIHFMMASIIGGAFIVYGVRFGAGAIILQSRASQFLGRISFPLYLIHLPILLSLGCWIFLVAVREGLPMSMAALASFGICMAVTLPLAWVFEKLIDRPAITLSKRLFESRSPAVPALH